MAAAPPKKPTVESALPGPMAAAEPAQAAPEPTQGFDEPTHPGNESVTVKGKLTADASLALGEDAPFDIEAYKAEVERIRAIRKPIGAFQLKLALPQRRGYKRHWFNDVPGRVEQKLSEGWAHIQDSKGAPLKRVVGTGRDNHALLGYAMEIPEIIWREEQDTFHKVAQSKMDDIRNHPVRSPKGLAQRSDQGKFYSPNEDMVRIIEDPVPRSTI